MNLRAVDFHQNYCSTYSCDELIHGILLYIYTYVYIYIYMYVIIYTYPGSPKTKLCLLVTLYMDHFRDHSLFGLELEGYTDVYGIHINHMNIIDISIYTPEV